MSMMKHNRLVAVIFILNFILRSLLTASSILSATKPLHIMSKISITTADFIKFGKTLHQPTFHNRFQWFQIMQLLHGRHIQWNLCNPTPEFSDILWHRTKIYDSKVFMLTKIKPEYSDILYNLTHFPGPLVCQIRQVPLYYEINVVGVSHMLGIQICTLNKPEPL